MIRKKIEMEVQRNVNMRGGQGTVVLEHLLDKEKDEFYGKGRLFSRITLEPGCSVGYHVHENEMECYYILKGSPEYDDNGEKVILHPGDAALTRSGEGHGILNNTDETVELIALILYQ
ncbi:MAG: cupin domain-containing protein [Clostridia bacterium]